LRSVRRCLALTPLRRVPAIMRAIPSSSTVPVITPMMKNAAALWMPRVCPNGAAHRVLVLPDQIKAEHGGRDQQHQANDDHERSFSEK
jgi:hypothetical protein